MRVFNRGFVFICALLAIGAAGLLSSQRSLAADDGEASSSTMTTDISQPTSSWRRFGASMLSSGMSIFTNQTTMSEDLQTHIDGAPYANKIGDLDIKNRNTLVGVYSEKCPISDKTIEHLIEASEQYSHPINPTAPKLQVVLLAYGKPDTVRAQIDAATKKLGKAVNFQIVVVDPDKIKNQSLAKYSGESVLLDSTGNVTWSAEPSQLAKNGLNAQMKSKLDREIAQGLKNETYLRAHPEERKYQHDASALGKTWHSFMSNWDRYQRRAALQGPASKEEIDAALNDNFDITDRYPLDWASDEDKIKSYRSKYLANVSCEDQKAMEEGFRQGMTGLYFLFGMDVGPSSGGKTSNPFSTTNPKRAACQSTSGSAQQCCIQGFKKGLQALGDNIKVVRADAQKHQPNEDACVAAFDEGSKKATDFCVNPAGCQLNPERAYVRYIGCYNAGFAAGMMMPDEKRGTKCKDSPDEKVRALYALSHGIADGPGKNIGSVTDSHAGPAGTSGVGDQ